MNLTKINPILGGLVLAAMTEAILWWLIQKHTLGLYALLLVFIAAIYCGFAIADGRTKPILLQFTVALLFMGIAALGLWVSPLILVVGYLCHALWDLLHHYKWIDTQVQKWYPPFCIIYDLAMAMAILWIIDWRL